MTVLQPIANERQRTIETHDDDHAPEHSDEAIALAFAEANADTLRYVAPWGQWFHYEDGVWRPDDTLDTYDRVRRQGRKLAAECRANDARTAKALASAKTVAAVEHLARSDRRLAATVDQWDADPWLLNTPDGVVDLLTGDKRPHRSTDYFTKITAVAPGGNCPRFRQFLTEITGGDKDLEQFIGRLIGYGLTGSTREHALGFFYGTGANGKSVLLTTIGGILHDYATVAPIESFTASHFERHPTELARLRGARFVTATETEEGRQWAEARIKALTGGDKIAARFMRQDFFDFTPQFKLVIAGNHLPGLKGVDEAMRRRFNLVPFAVTVPKEQRDPNLTEKLKDEWPGILQWLIEGCLDWQRRGLSPPSAVTKATDAYLEAEDAIHTWLTERCLTDDPQAWESSSALFADWKTWAERAGEPARTQKRFSNDLQARGFQHERHRTGRGFLGLSLIPQMNPWSEP